ncbi:histidine utilization repressor [Sphingomonas sp.]|uniref:histidine utilization repressor n=1 Tax=Sphingomonas sp. TaxID=28214 RepID=UPI002DD620D7|nr:histidine utilization repressor [Sphingomonas sp.]
MTALHERIRRDLEVAILSGARAPGSRIPVEHALMADYGCSRMTVNKALAALAAQGFIERRKKAGSFVARPRVHSVVLDIPDLAVEVARRGQAYRYLLERRVIAPADTDTEAEIAQGTDLLRVSGTHLADGIPLAIEDRLVSLAAVPHAREADFAETSPGAWLLENIAWTEAESRIAALGADVAAARRLGVAEGTACLAIERRTWRGGEPITFVRQQFVGAAYDLTARFGPATSALEPARPR